MKRLFFDRRARFLFFPIAGAAFLALISLVVMQLWNHLLPDILHAGIINFWQAMGLFVLCKILFGFGKGGGGFGRNREGMRGRMQEHLKNMTPEQRERLKEKMKNRSCGSFRSQFGRRGFENDWVNFDEDTTEKTEPTK